MISDTMKNFKVCTSCRTDVKITKSPSNVSFHVRERPWHFTTDTRGSPKRRPKRPEASWQWRIGARRHGRGCSKRVAVNENEMPVRWLKLNRGDCKWFRAKKRKGKNVFSAVSLNPKSGPETLKSTHLGLILPSSDQDQTEPYLQRIHDDPVETQKDGIGTQEGGILFVYLGCAIRTGMATRVNRKNQMRGSSRIHSPRPGLTANAQTRLLPIVINRESGVAI